MKSTIQTVSVQRNELAGIVRFACVSFLLAIVFVLSSCADGSKENGPHVLYHPESGPLLPFPSNLYTIKADTLTGLRPDIVSHTAGNDSILELYKDVVEQVEELDGFGTSAPIIIGFSATPDLALLPGTIDDFASQQSASVSADSPIGLLDSTTGRRIPYFWRFAFDDNQLAIFPAEALLPKRTYIYYVTDALVDLGGRQFVADDSFVDLIEKGDTGSGGNPYEKMVQEDTQRISSELADKLILADHFTTQSIYDETVTLRDHVIAKYEESIDSVTDTGRAVEYKSVKAIYEATWSEYDYRDAQHHLDAAATVPHKTVRLPFYIGIPKTGAQPFPVVLIQHGLGDSRDVFFKVVEQFSSMGFATVAIDAPEHGERVPVVTDVAGILGRFRDSLGFWVKKDHVDFQMHRIRDLFRQGVIDHTEIRQALTNTDYDEIDFDQDGTADLDLSQWFYYGQSMGAIIGTMTVAQASDIKAATLNVGGGRLTGYAFYFPAIEIARPAIVSHTGSWANAMRLIGLLQTVIERADPVNYARLLQNELLEGAPERDILLQFVLDDGTLPNGMNWELAYQADLPLLLPSPIMPPLQQTTLAVAGGVTQNHLGRTGGYVVYDTITTRDGVSEAATHGNMFSSLEATQQAACLFRTALTKSKATIFGAGIGCTK